MAQVTALRRGEEGAQLALFEPTGAEVIKLCDAHAAWADQAIRKAELAESLGFGAVARWHFEAAAAHVRTAYELAMLADFEQLGGVA